MRLIILVVTTKKRNLYVVETICDLLEGLAPQKPSGVNRYRDLKTLLKIVRVTMLVMLLILQKSSMILVGCQRKHLKLDYEKQFSGIWAIVLGGRECFQVLIEWRELGRIYDI